MEYNTRMATSIGKQLQQIRESQGVSLEEIAQKTHIALIYLKAIEEGDEDSLPSKVQLRGFLRLYANELGVELDDLQVSGYHLAKEKPPSEPIDEEVVVDEPAPKLVEEHEQDEEPEPEQKPASEENIFVSPPPPSTSEPETSFDKQAPQTSADLFEAIGAKLRLRRELLSLSIKEIHENIHIREEYLEWIELGSFSQLPSPVQAKGMLVNYAEFLNLDTDSLLLQYSDALQMQRIEKQKALPQRRKRSARELSPTALRIKNFFSLDLLIISGLFIVFAIFVVWGVNRIFANDSPGVIETDIPGVSDVLLATDTPTPIVTLDPDADEVSTEDQDEIAQEEETPLFTPVVSTEPINLILVPRQRLWVQVTVDDQVVFQGRLLPGNAYDFSGQEQVDILTGNAGALQIFFNQEDIGSLGLPGQVVVLSFTENGLVLPPPTSTPTITPTPETTPTPTPTATPGENDA